MKIFKFIYYILIAFIVAVALLLIVSTVPITGNVKVLTVLSGSMEPSIKTGSVVVVKPAGEYKSGDVITFGPYSKTRAPITHRITEVKQVEGQEIYITKGDANDGPDSKETLKKDVVGKVLFSIPFLGYAVNFAKQPLGFALLIIVPASIIIFDELKNIYGEIKKKKEEGGEKPNQ